VVQNENDLDDEAMFKLDKKLAAAFRSMRKGSKVDKDKTMKLKHYKMRQTVHLLTYLLTYNLHATTLLQQQSCLVMFSVSVYIRERTLALICVLLVQWLGSRTRDKQVASLTAGHALLG